MGRRLYKCQPELSSAAGKGDNDCRGGTGSPRGHSIALMGTAWKANGQVDRRLLITQVFFFSTHLLKHVLHA